MSAAAVNLAALQRMDPSVLKIVGDGSSFVTVYERKGAEWVRKDVEGSLFIVQRSSSPVYQLVVLNRLSLTNFVAPLSPGFEWQRQGEYVTFRDRDDAAKVVHGLWFGQSKDLEAFVATLTSVMSGPAPVPAAASAPPKVTVEVKPKGLVPTQVKPRPTSQKPAAAPSPAPAASPKSYRDIAKGPEAPVGPVSLVTAPVQQSGVRVPVESLFASAGTVPAASAPAPAPAPVSVVLAPAVASLFASAAPVAPAPASAPTGSATVDKFALKAALTSLLEDDGFLTALATAYQQQLAARRR